MSEATQNPIPQRPPESEMPNPADMAKHAVPAARRLVDSSPVLDAVLQKQAPESESEAWSTERPLDYSELLAGDEPVVFFGEDHRAEGTLLDIAAHAAELKSSGINAMLLEASEDQDFSRINAGDFSDLDHIVLGPDVRFLYGFDEDLTPTADIREPYRQELIRHGDGVKNARQTLVKALVGAGIACHPVDSARYWASLGQPSTARQDDEAIFAKSTEREDTLSANIIAKQREYGRVGVLIGKAHTSEEIRSMRGAPHLKHRETARRLTEEGVPHRTIHFSTMTPTIAEPGREVASTDELDRAMYRDENGVYKVITPTTAQQDRIAALGRSSPTS